MSQSKTEWRRALLDARRALTPAIRRSHSRALAERLGTDAAFASAPAVFAYEAIGAEVDPAPLVDAARSTGRVVYLPPADHADDWVASAPADGTPPGTPPSDAPVVVLVPGVAFDPSGGRLGRGAGFYDRALARLRAARPIVAIGLAFEVQIVPRLPLDSWDQRVDLIATEARLIRPTAAARADAARNVEEVSRS